MKYSVVSLDDGITKVVNVSENSKHDRIEKINSDGQGNRHFWNGHLDFIVLYCGRFYIISHAFYPYRTFHNCITDRLLIILFLQMRTSQSEVYL